MLKQPERILCLRAQIAWLWQRLLLSAIGRKEGKEMRYPRWEEAGRERTHSRRGIDSSRGLVKSPHDVGYRREAPFFDRRAQKDLSSEFRPLLSVLRDKQIVCRALKHAEIAPTRRVSSGRLAICRRDSKDREIVRVSKQEGQGGASGICDRAKNGKADRDLMGNFA